jgi:hypothetical protein
MNFDFNIDNYNKNDFIEMFELPENYNKNQLQKQKEKLEENVRNNGELDILTKNKTLDFIEQVQLILLRNVEDITDLKDDIRDFYNSRFDLKQTPIQDSEEHMVQIQEKKPYLSSFPSEYFPGIINPLKKRTIKKILNIDSRFRENYYSSSSSNFSITLPLQMKNVLSIQLSSIEFPTTYYNVSKQYNNNFFTISVNTLSEVVQIPDGNYNFEGIVNAINKQIVLLGDPFQYITFIININNNNGSGQMMVGWDGNETSPYPLNFELNFQADKFGNEDRSTPLPLKLGWLLGFRNGIYTNNQNYVSEGVVDMSGPRYIYLVLDDFNNNVNNGFFSAFNSSILNNNILARLSLQSQNFNIFTENNLNIVTVAREYFGPVNLLNLNIQLLDEYGRILNLNNMDFSFCINLTCIYDI